MRKSYFEIRKSADKQFYFVLIARNGEVIGTSEMYKAKQSCKRGIDSVVNNCIDDMYVRRKSKDDKDYFVLKSRNGRVILVSETYSSSRNCINGMVTVTENALDAEVVDKTLD